MMVYTSNN